MRLFIYIFCLCLIASSCKNTEKESPAIPKENTETITLLSLHVSEKSSLPFLFTDNNELFLSYVTENEGVATLYYTSLKDGKWVNSEPIASGKDWFVNWADFPSIVKNNGYLTAHFLKKSDSAVYAYDIFITQKNDLESSWSTPKKLHSDTTKTEHGFVTMLPFRENAFFATWLDGRNTVSHHDIHSQMTIRGAIINADGMIEEDTFLDERVCDCCQTTATITDNGPVVLYRDRSESEVRDISIVRWIGGKWTAPKPVYNDYWEIFGCPVNGPSADAFQNTLAVAWYTGAENNPKVQVAFSKDNGETFLNPVQIDEGNPVGRVAVAMIDTKNALVSWVEAEGDTAKILAVKIHIDGEVSSPVFITDFSPSRASGFPQMKLFKNKVYFAWTGVDKNDATVQTGYIPLEQF